MSKTIINQNQVGILMQGGRVIRTLKAGVYRTYGFRNEAIVTYPVHSQSYVYALYLRTKESAMLTVDVTIGVTVNDAVKLYLSGKPAYEVVSQSVTKQLQGIAGGMSVSELLESDMDIDSKALNSEIAVYGIAAAVELAPKVRLPRNLQNAIDAQEVARQRAKAELEEARGRSAVIRHYANTAKITKDNPDLLRLLLGQKAKSINVAFDAAGKTAK